MKKSFLLIIIATIVAGLSASAQFRFGIRAGMTINELTFDKSVLHSSNRNGFTGGITGEFTIPVIGLSVDGSLMYTNRSFDVSDGYGEDHYTRSYINIPLNLKYKIGLPFVGNIIRPFITTGPDFSFLVSKKNIEEGVRNRSFDTAWTAGIGVELINHLQIAANYGWGLSKSVSGDDAIYSAKNRCWTITASYYF